MDKDIYNIIGAFEYDGNKMLVLRMNGAACVMSEEEYNRIVIAERKYKQQKNRKVA